MADNHVEESNNNHLAEPSGESTTRPVDATLAEPQTPPTPQVDASLPERSPADEPASLSRLSPGAIFFGVLVTAGLIGFVLLARITVHPFDQINHRMRVIDVWRRLRKHLPDVAHPTMLGIVFDISMILIVVGSIACIWLALMATDEPPELPNSPMPPDPIAPVELHPSESGQ
jgi:hypothetical protein